MATKAKPLSTYSVPAAAPAHVETTPVAPATDAEKQRQKVFRLTPAQDRKLREFCAHQDTTIQDVVLEGINLVFKSRGLPPLK
jgi:hypothetical protein